MKAIGTLLKAIGGMTVVLAVAYLFYFGGQDLIPRRSAAPSAPVTAPVVTAQARPDSFTAVVDAARLAVVNISTLRGQRAGEIRSASSLNGTLASASRRSRHRASARESSSIPVGSCSRTTT